MGGRELRVVVEEHGDRLVATVDDPPADLPTEHRRFEATKAQAGMMRAWIRMLAEDLGFDVTTQYDVGRLQRYLDLNGMVVPHVFHRNGEPIVTFYRSWAAACVAAGLGREVRKPDVLNADGTLKRQGALVRRVITRIPHDYRRSAARNLSRAGVPEPVIMALCGWVTRSVFDRYRVVPEQDLAAGLAKLAGPAKAKRSKVRRMRGRK